MLPQSKVEIDPAMQRDAGYYECQVDLMTPCHNHQIVLQAYNKHAVETKVQVTAV